MTAAQPRAVRRVGDAVGLAAGLIATIVLHWGMFSGDQYFPLRFLLTPSGDPIAFVSFAGCLVALIVLVVRISGDRQWGLLTGASVPTDDAVATAPARPLAGPLARRALRTAAICAAASSLFMIMLVIAVIPVFAVVFGVAALLILGVYLVVRVLEERRAT